MKWIIPEWTKLLACHLLQIYSRNKDSVNKEQGIINRDTLYEQKSEANTMFPNLWNNIRKILALLY
jgi:hypothetical protein